MPGCPLGSFSRSGYVRRFKRCEKGLDTLSQWGGHCLQGVAHRQPWRYLSPLPWGGILCVSLQDKIIVSSKIHFAANHRGWTELGPSESTPMPWPRMDGAIMTGARLCRVDIYTFLTLAEVRRSGYQRPLEVQTMIISIMILESKSISV